jgi:hypothetical protein
MSIWKGHRPEIGECPFISWSYLVRESTQKFLDSLNEQFLPAVRFTNANITSASGS